MYTDVYRSTFFCFQLTLFFGRQNHCSSMCACLCVLFVFYYYDVCVLCINRHNQICPYVCRCGLGSFHQHECEFDVMSNFSISQNAHAPEKKENNVATTIIIIISMTMTITHRMTMTIMIEQPSITKQKKYQQLNSATDSADQETCSIIYVCVCVFSRIFI